MSEISQQPAMDIETTFECPHCGKELPTANQLTHEVACARMHRDNNQRAPMAQPIVRQSSSSAIPESNPVQQRQQPMPRRDDRRIVENKLVTCPNCEKSVREQDINSHMDNECLKNEMIPCEFCEEAVPMNSYSTHVESCPRRADNQRDESPIRERPEPERIEHEPVQPQPQASSERDRSPERGSSQGGFGGFLRNLAGSAASHLLGLNTNNQQQHQQQQQQPQRQQGGLLSHIFGAPETEEQIEQRRQQRQRQMEQRQREEARQREFLEHMFGQPQVPRNLAPNNQNAMIPYNGPNGGSRVVRTIERGPGGVVIVRQRVVPGGNDQFPMFQQNRMNGPMEVNPLEMLLGMMGGSFGGMQAIGNGNLNMGGAPAEETGLDKETINSLALMKYNKEQNKHLDEELRKCPICLDDFDDGQEVRFLWCTHRFHRGCVDQWLEKHTTCPLCKKDFSEAEQGFSP